MQYPTGWFNESLQLHSALLQITSKASAADNTYLSMIWQSLVLAVGMLLLPPSLHIAFSAAYASEPAIPPIIMNELEIGLDGSSWLELLNTGDTPFSISNLSLNVIKEDSNMTQMNLRPYQEASTFTIPAGSYHVVTISLIEPSSLYTIQLFEGEVMLDELEGISDSFGDDRTWQRFPDGSDTGYFEDWVFADSTKGEDNGNMGQSLAECYLNPLCMDLNIPLHQTRVINVNGTAFAIDLFSTSPVTEVRLDQAEKKISTKLSMPARDSDLSFIHITFPKTLLSGDLLVSTDQSESYPFFTVTNETHTRIIIEHEAGDRTMEIVGTNVVPEFRSIVVLLVVPATIALLILHARRFIGQSSY